MEAQLQLVHYYLDNELNENALFATERLHVLDPAEPAWTHLRSLACLRLGQYALASEYSRNEALKGEHLGCCYVFSQACLRQKNYPEGIKALKQARPLWATREQIGDRSPSHRFIPDFSSVNRLLGKLYRASGDAKTAATHFEAALEANAFLWDAFTDLCDLCASETPLQVANIFQLRNIPSDIKPAQVASAKSMPEGQDVRNLMVKRTVTRRKSPLATQVPQSSAQEVSPPVEDEVKPARLAEPPATRSRSARNENEMVDVTSSSSKLPDAPQRRSARLLKQDPPVSTLTHRPAPSSKTVGTASKRIAKPRIPVRPAKQKASVNRPSDDTKPSVSILLQDAKIPEPVSSEPTKTEPHHAFATTPSGRAKLQLLIDLFSKLGSGYYHLSRFQPKECLEAFSTLPGDQQATPWVLSKTARAQYELMSYKDSRSTFRILRKIAPAWIEDFEVYSTVLWHLKEDVALAFLAHELSDSHFLSPQTWCAIGNSLSLQKLRNEAIKAFRRACQLQPPLAQAFSLLGYEYIDTEQYAEATTAFRQALQVDARHYLAWVGLGCVQEKLGQGEKAIKFYAAARQINPNNAVIFTYLARVLERAGKHQLALGYLRRGLSLDPPETTSSLIRMQTASIQLRLGQPAEALQALHLVEQFVSDEPRVHFFLGEAYAISGKEKRHLALKHYTIALSLAPWSEDIQSAILALNDDV
ncbi:hypothetical protein BKA56DRAFT_675381 [Ilyonectria sp. MPI-CAGE-AT-0026]|nr:hypothetical protein BKA56DRAFT_675381 [Ilyonectria sp. MPI-CAGE-AT-0026]